mgnify:CR=1 FL=1
MTPRAYLLGGTIPQGWVRPENSCLTGAMCANPLGWRKPLLGFISAGRAGFGSTRNGEHSKQVMPAAFGTRLHHIRGVLLPSALNLFDVFAVGDALAMFGQTRPEHVRHQNNVGDFANRACGFRRFAKMFGGANEFWMSITDRFATDSPTLHFINQCATR